MKTKAGMLVLVATMMAIGSYADTFGTGTNEFSIDFVNIGYAGNVVDTRASRGFYFGAVGYDYSIGKYEVTIGQFAKARSVDNRISDGDEGYWNDGTRTVGIGGPASQVTWFEAAKFANWLTTGDAYDGAYQFNGSGTLTAVDRDAAVAAHGTVYVLPTEDEWYKAAYYKPVDDGSYSLYASGLDTVPTHGTSSGWNYYLWENGGHVNDSPNYTWETGFGGEEQNGTYDMMGNVWEWNESTWDGTLDTMDENRIILGGSFAEDSYEAMRSSDRGSISPTATYSDFGFRVVAIPEGHSAVLVAVIGGLGLFVRRRILIA